MIGPFDITEIMVITKQNEDKSSLIVKTVNVTKTFQNIKPGSTVHFTRRELGNKDNTVLSAAYRLNVKAKRIEFTVRLDDNDGSYYVTRHS